MECSAVDTVFPLALKGLSLPLCEDRRQAEVSLKEQLLRIFPGIACGANLSDKASKNKILCLSAL